MRKHKGFSLIELLIVVAIILIIAAIAIPNLMRSRMAANESSAVYSLRTLNTAETTYNTTYPQVGYTCSLSALGPVPSGSLATSAAAGLIDGNLASGMKAGYLITPGTCAVAGSLTVTYQWKADPSAPGSTGQRYFCTDQSNVLKFDLTSSTTCLATGMPVS